MQELLCLKMPCVFSYLRQWLQDQGALGLPLPPPSSQCLLMLLFYLLPSHETLTSPSDSAFHPPSIQQSPKSTRFHSNCLYSWLPAHCCFSGKSPSSPGNVAAAFLSEAQPSPGCRVDPVTLWSGHATLLKILWVREGNSELWRRGTAWRVKENWGESNVCDRKKVWLWEREWKGAARREKVNTWGKRLKVEREKVKLR